MMGIKIAVVSDTHGERNLLSSVIRDTAPLDMIIHCGDGVRDILAADIPEHTIVLKVKGNTDTSPDCDADDILFEKILHRNIMIVHGHQFGVKSGLKKISDAAIKADAEIIIFGHTHEQVFKNDHPLLFNPGNLSGGKYGIIHASDERWVFEHKRIKKG